MTHYSCGKRNFRTFPLNRRQSSLETCGTITSRMCSPSCEQVHLLGANILIAFLQPALAPTLTVVPILVVTVALPYVGSRALQRQIGAAVIITLFVVLVEWVIPARSDLPPWFVNTFVVASLLAVVVLIFLLLWQFSSRLT